MRIRKLLGLSNTGTIGGGEQGPQGLPGKDGKDGEDGYTPIKGVDYTDGTRGPQGLQGEIGPQGPQGLKGDTGLTGSQGLKGDTGSQGVNGDQGIQGVAGNNALSLYTINVQALTSSPVDSQTVYFGTLPKAPVTVAGTSKIYIPRAGTIKAVEIYCYSGTPGTAESWSLYVRLNNATDTLIKTLAISNSERRFNNASLNIPVVVGDYIEIKGVQPLWATNPLTTIYGGFIYIE